MLECKHEKAAMKHPGYDPEYWAEFPCPCAWSFTTLSVGLLLVSPLLVVGGLVGVVVEKVRGE